MPGVPGSSQTATVSRCGSLGAGVPPQQPAGLHGLMLAPGTVEPLKEQDWSLLAWKEKVPLARTFSVSPSVLCHGALALCSWLPLVLSELPGPPSLVVPLCVQALRCTMAGQVGAHPQACTEGWDGL